MASIACKLPKLHWKQLRDGRYSKARRRSRRTPWTHWMAPRKGYDTCKRARREPDHLFTLWRVLQPGEVQEISIGDSQAHANSLPAALEYLLLLSDRGHKRVLLLFWGCPQSTNEFNHCPLTVHESSSYIFLIIWLWFNFWKHYMARICTYFVLV
jgi:hypothetical protein